MSIYFIQVGDDGPVKIGYSTNPKERCRYLQSLHFEKLKIIREIDGDFRAERYFHKRFLSNKLRGEWFNFSHDMMTEAPYAIKFAPTPALLKKKYQKVRRERLLRRRDPVLSQAIAIMGGLRA